MFMDDETKMNDQLEEIRYQMLGGKDAVYFRTEAQMARHLRMWPIRFVAGLLIFGGIAWMWSWGKWLVVGWTAIMIFGLCNFFYCRRNIRKKFDAMESKLNRPWTGKDERQGEAT